MKKIVAFIYCFFIVAQASERKTDLTPDQALGRLLEGNKRYVGSQLQHPHQGADRRHELETTDHPFACILSCADSRVPPEIVFHEGLGDLFVVRLLEGIEALS